MSLAAMRIQAERERPLTNDELKQALMQEMINAAPQVWKNVIMTNTDGETIEFELGNISDLTTGTITTTNSTVTVDSTDWMVTVFQELGADQPTGPDPSDIEHPIDEPILDSTEDGEFESASPLRDENETDTMGTEFDPGSVGSAEAWFRNLRGDDQSQAVEEVRDFPCRTCDESGEPGPPETDNACPQPPPAMASCPDCGYIGVSGHVHPCGWPDPGIEGAPF